MSSEGSDSILEKSRENLKDAVAIERRSGRRDRRRLRWVKPGFQVRFLIYTIVPSLMLLLVLGFSLGVACATLRCKDQGSALIHARLCRTQ